MLTGAGNFSLLESPDGFGVAPDFGSPSCNVAGGRTGAGSGKGLPHPNIGYTALARVDASTPFTQKAINSQ